jgi:hypothetical protein
LIIEFNFIIVIFNANFVVNLSGLNKLEGKASGGALPLSVFSSYDQVHGTSLYYMASQLPSVSTNQSVTSSDFEQLQAVAEKQFGEQSQKVSCWWSFLRYLLVVAGLIIAPIWTKLLTNLTDDCIYPLYKDAILKRLKSNSG